MCIEDAVVLSNLLAKVEKGDEGEMERVFEAYDAVRRPRTFKAVETSWEMSRLSGLKEPGTLDDPEKIKQKFATRFDWLWHADLDEHVEQALSAFPDSGWTR